MNRIQKEELIKSLKEKLEGKNFALAAYQGLDVINMEDLRKKLRAESYEFKVVKNTLLNIALKDLGIEDCESYLNDTTAIAVQNGDSFKGLKVLADFMKDNESFKIKAGRIYGQTVDAVGVQKIAALPSKEVLIAELLARLQAPVSKLAYALKFPLNQIVFALNAIKESKDSK